MQLESKVEAVLHRPLNNSYHQLFSFSHILAFSVNVILKIYQESDHFVLSLCRSKPPFPLVWITAVISLWVSLFCLCPLQTMNSIAASKPDHITQNSKFSHYFFYNDLQGSHLQPHLLLSHSQTLLANWLLGSYDNLPGMYTPWSAPSKVGFWGSPFTFVRSLPKCPLFSEAILSHFLQNFNSLVLGFLFLVSAFFSPNTIN